MAATVDGMRVLVVGAGLAGLTCAQHLMRRGHRVVVLDKGRAPGGRASTRVDAHGQRFDHGAQFFTARSEPLLEHVQRWRQDGVVDVWEPRLGPGTSRCTRRDPWWVGTPGMGSVAARLAEGLTIHSRETVTAVAHDGKEWQVMASSRWTADALVLAMPAPQCANLLDPASAVAQFAASAALDPCWAGMLRVEGAPARFDLLERDEGVLAWAAREASKPRRDVVAGSELWVVHAGPQWSREHLEDPPEDVAHAMAGALAAELDVPIPSVHAVAHRWRYAKPTVRPRAGAADDARTRLTVCGDWVEGARIESAVNSGVAAADRVLG